MIMGDIKIKNHSGSSALYGIGVVGALIYFLQHATTVSAVIIGIIKAFFWPAVIVFQALTLLKIH